MDLISTADAENRAPAAQNLEICTNLGARARREALGGIERLSTPSGTTPAAVYGLRVPRALE
jgi:hypothetical protein